MLNGLWAGMILIGIIFGAWNGKMPELTNAALDSSKDAVSLCITMLGVMAFWCGIIGGGILATMASTGAAVVYVLVMQRWGKRK